MAPQSFSVVTTFDSREIKTLLGALEPKQWQFTTALALTKTAQRVELAERTEMRRVFDRPTPFTLNSLRVQPATKQKLEARVWFKDPPKLTETQHYLLPDVYGGERRHKNLEAQLWRMGFLSHGTFLVPASGAPLDAFGNVPRGLYQQVLSQLRAQRDSKNNETAKSKARNLRQFKERFFYARRGNTSRLHPGIWVRSYRGSSLGFAFSSTTVSPVFLETKAPHYSQVFDFFGVAQRVSERMFPQEFEHAAERTVRTAR